MDRAYLIHYNIKKGETAKAVVFSNSTFEAVNKFYSDWLNDYNNSVASGDNLICNPNELERISAEPICLASDVVGR